MRADRSRQLPAHDPLGRELMISCGGAVAHAQVAARGRSVRVEWLPDPSDRDLVAGVHLGAPQPPTEQDTRLLEAVWVRRSDRSAFDPAPVPEAAVRALAAVAAEDGAHLRAEQDPDRLLELEVLVATNDQVSRRDPGLQADLHAWVRGETRPREGVPADALPDHGAGRGSSLTLRDFDPAASAGPAPSTPVAEPPVAGQPVDRTPARQRGPRPTRGGLMLLSSLVRLANSRHAVTHLTSGAPFNAARSLDAISRAVSDRQALSTPAEEWGDIAVLSSEECWEQLAGHSVGRLAYVAHGDVPDLVPVNYVLADREVPVRSGPGPKLQAAQRRAVAAFEVDELDPLGRCGWSVVVIGRLEVLPPQSLLHAAVPQPWANGPRRHLVRLTPQRITGRRLLAEPAP